MMRPFLILALPLGLHCAVLAPGSAAAEITQPDCATLVAWAGSTDFREVQTLNPSTVLGFPTAFLGEEMVAIYGKTGPEFTAEDVAQDRPHATAGPHTVHKATRKNPAGNE